MTARADAIAAKIEAFIRTEVIPYEKDPRTGPHGPSDDLVQELRDKARKAVCSRRTFCPMDRISRSVRLRSP
jgi:hypothetical protein